MSAQDTVSPQSTDDKKLMPERIAERFDTSGFRTEKFSNNDEDSSKVDRCSDSPTVMEAFEVFFNAK
jgi:hypothetical protein